MEGSHGDTLPPGSSQRHPYFYPYPSASNPSTAPAASLKHFLPPAPQKVKLPFLL